MLAEPASRHNRHQVPRIGFGSMEKETKRRVHENLRKAQTAFEKAEAERDKVSAARRESFGHAQNAGLTLRITLGWAWASVRLSQAMRGSAIPMRPVHHGK